MYTQLTFALSGGFYSLDQTKEFGPRQGKTVNLLQFSLWTFSVQH